MANANTKLSWLGIAAIAAAAAFFTARYFFPDIIKQIAAGIVAFVIFIGSRIFGKK